MASDSKISGASTEWATMKKIKKVEGHLLGGAGEIEILHWFLTKFKPDWIKIGLTTALPSNIKVDDFEGIIVAPNKKIYQLSDKMMITPLKVKKYIAIGSGEPVALGAMEIGANAIEAVRAAVKHDPHSGGRIQFIKL